MPQTVQRQPTPPVPDAVETHASAAFDDEAFAEDAYEVVAPEYASEEQGEGGDDFTADDGYSDQPASTFQPPAPDSVQRQPDPVEHDEFNETGVADGFAEAAENDDG
jgi:hypothetical protein